MATIKDVAKLANVSVATVSRVLNGSDKVSQRTMDKVLQAQKDLGFVLNANARALAHKDSETIGIIVSDVSDPYFGIMVKACENVAQKSGYTLLVGQGFHEQQREENALENLLARKCRGLVVHALGINDNDLKNYMLRFPFMVLINRTLSGFENRCVNIANLKGSLLAVETLINKGHKKIAYIKSSHNILDTSQRYLGYQQALKKHHIPFNDNYVFVAEPSTEGGAQAASEILEKNLDITAIACYNDSQAAGLMAKLTEKGYNIPKDISVIGFDDLYLAPCLNPPLTTVKNPVSDMATYAIELSISLYDKEIENSKKIPLFPVSLVERKSVKELK